MKVTPRLITHHIEKNPLAEVIFSDGGSSIDTGTLDKTEISALAAELLQAAEELLEMVKNHEAVSQIRQIQVS